MTCPCEKNQCAGSNPGLVLEVQTPGGPVLFHKVTYPASLGDDTTVDPATLPYRNVLLEFEVNKHSYLYSSDGVPTFISLGNVNTEELQAAISNLENELTTETYYRVAADEELENKLTALNSDLDETNQKVEDYATTTNNALTNLQNQIVVKDFSVNADASTISISKERGKLGVPDTPRVDLPLPVASSENAGVMNTATYNAVQVNSENIDSILGGAVVIDDLTSAPSQTELTESWMTATGKDKLINRASIYDTENKLVWYYYENANEWKSMPAGDATVSVSIANNDTPGIVKGSTEDGQIAVEADGSMSLNGYDGIQHDLDNLAELVAGIDVPQLPRYVYAAPTPYLTTGSRTDTSGSYQYWRIPLYDQTTKAQLPTTQWPTVEIPTGYNANEPSLINPADYQKLDSLTALTPMEQIRVSNLPPAVVTGFEDTTYGADNITLHLDTKDLATGGVAVQELLLQPATPNTAEVGGHSGIMSAFQATQLQALAESGGGGTITTAQFDAVWEAA